MKQRTKRISIIVLGIILLGAILFFAYHQFIQSSLKTADYKQAQQATDALRKSYTQSEEAYFTYSTGSADATATLNTAQAKLADYKAKSAQLDDLKALQAGSLAPTYITFKTKNNLYIAEVSGYLNDRKTLVDLQKSDCYAAMVAFPASTKDLLNTFDTSYKKCQPAIDELKQSTNTGIATYGKALDAYFKDRRVHYSELQKAVDGVKDVDVKNTFVKITTMTPPDAAKEIQSARAKASALKAVQDLANQAAQKFAEANNKK